MPVFYLVGHLPSGEEVHVPLPHAELSLPLSPPSAVRKSREGREEAEEEGGGGQYPIAIPSLLDYEVFTPCGRPRGLIDNMRHKWD